MYVTSIETLHLSLCFQEFVVDRDHIASAQLPPGSAHDDPEGLGVPPLLTDEFSGVIRVGVDGEGGTVFCYLGLDDNEFRSVNQYTSTQTILNSSL
jgi:hypothetical protein